MACNYLRNKLVDYGLKSEIIQKEIELFVKANFEFVDVGFTTLYLDWKAKKIKDEHESFYKAD